jgi:HD-GYP domain-containing protein (c-di-GMP phosphodiesterase class II)
VGDMAANALNRSTLYEQTEQRVQRLAALHAIDIAITASFDLRMTLGIFLDHLMSQMRVDAAAVLLLNSTTQTLEYAAARGLNTRPLRPAPLRLSDSLPGRVATQRQAVHIANLNELRSPGTRPYPAGQATFTSYYGVPLVAKGRVQGVLEILQRGAMPADSEWVEFLNSLATQAAIAIDNATLFTDLQRSNVELNLAYDATIEGWSRVLEARGIESSGHTRRVAELTVRLAQAAGFGAAEMAHLRRGALLHDIGMLSIPEAVLLKPGPLSEAERAIVQQHPDLGFGILAPIAYLRPALDIPYCHHERWDGGGYPRGLRGDVIPPAARLFAVVDVRDALRADRPYRAAWTDAAAVAYLQEKAGTQFDPQMVRMFLQQGVGEEK